MASADPTLAERDAEAKRELVKSVPPEQVVERLAPGIQWVPGPEIDRVVLFTVYAPRPWAYMSEYKRVKIFCPPIAADQPAGRRPGRARPRLQGARRREPPEAAEAPPGRADLAHGCGAGDRAREVDHPSPLAILRQAGFVLIREGDDSYRLRPDLRPEPGALLQQYLGT